MQLSNDNTFRGHLFLLGALAGLCGYFITEFLPNITNNQRLLLFLGAFAYSGFLSSMLMAGAVTWRKVLIYSLPLAGVSSLLLLWVSFRFEDVGKTFDEAIPLFAFAKLVVLPLPFFIACETAFNGWRDYEVLFQRAWGLFVKTLTACIFVGVFWGVMWTSAYLLSLVGLTFLKELLEEELIWMPLNGAMFGLALAVLFEMENVVETLRNLVVRLLRLLLPIVALVTAVFLAFVPIRGLEDVFGHLSAAGTILWMAVIAVALITASLDATDKAGTQNPILLWSARALAVLLPIMAGIAVYALYLRVNQYGWTPSRLLAVIGACVVLGYAAAYAFAALAKGDNWRATIRQANVYLALGLISLSVLWLTPALNAGRISANTQVKRYLAGKSSAMKLPLWEMKNDWGWAGIAALAKIQAHSKLDKDALLSARLSRLETAQSKYKFNRGQRERSLQEKADELQKLVTIVPEGVKDVSGFFAAFSEWELKRHLANCKTESACILLVDDFLTFEEGQEAIFFQSKSEQNALIDIKLIKISSAPDETGSRIIHLKDIAKGKWLAMKQKILTGEYELIPTGVMSLKVGDEQIAPMQR